MENKDTPTHCQMCGSKFRFIKCRVTYHLKDRDVSHCLSCPAPVDKPIVDNLRLL